MQIGDKYGRFTVIDKTDDYRKVVCVCECGTIKTVRTDALKSGVSRSCGCLKLEKLRLSDPTESAFNALYSTQYASRAIKRGYVFELSKDRFRELTKQPCYYCGINPHRTYKNGKSEYTYNGIDRIDNAKGYIEGNVRTACFTCNQAKHTMSTDEFEVWIDRLAWHKIQIGHVWETSRIQTIKEQARLDVIKELSLQG